VVGASHLFAAMGDGTFTFTGPTAPGSASWTSAPVVDLNGQPPATDGGGSVAITLGATAYSSSTLDSVSFVVQDTNTTDYLALDGYYIWTDAANVENATEVVAIVLKSDFAIGTPIALDGIDRVALLASGPTRDGRPASEGAAISGTLTIASGSTTIGSTVTATVNGDFGPIEFVDGGGSGSGSGTSTIVAGGYTLALVDGGQAYCDGSLAGHEADFAAITLANVGLAGGAVTVATPDVSIVTVDGAVIGSDFAATPFELDAQNGSLFAGFSDATGSGPDGTAMIGKYLVVDGSTATPTSIAAGVGVGYATPDRSGTCTVAFDASLTAP